MVSVGLGRLLITSKASDARLPKSRGTMRRLQYAAVTRDEGNAADDALMLDQGSCLLLVPKEQNGRQLTNDNAQPVAHETLLSPQADQ